MSYSKKCKLLYFSYVDLRDTTGPSINENSFLNSIESSLFDINIVSGDKFSITRPGTKLKIFKILNYLVYILCSGVLATYYLLIKRNFALVIFRLGPLPIIESFIVLLFKPKFVIKTVDRGNIEWNSGSNFLNYVHVFLCRYLFKSAYCIDTVSAFTREAVLDSISNSTEKISELRDKIKIISNGVNTELFSQYSKDRSRKLLKLDKYDYLIGYTGNYALSRGGKEAIQVTALLKNAGYSIGCIILGYEPNQRDLEDLCKSHEVMDCVSFIGSIPFKDVPKYTSALDVGFSILSQDLSGASPQKVRQYVASGAKVITTPGSDEFIQEIGCGFVVSYGDIQGMYEKTIQLLSDEFIYDEVAIKNYVDANLAVNNYTTKRFELWDLPSINAN